MLINNDSYYRLFILPMKGKSKKIFVVFFMNPIDCAVSFSL